MPVAKYNAVYKLVCLFNQCNSFSIDFVDDITVNHHTNTLQSVFSQTPARVFRLFTSVADLQTLKPLRPNWFNKAKLPNYIGKGCFSEARRGHYAGVITDR